jgi:hypothetical protein
VFFPSGAARKLFSFLFSSALVYCSISIPPRTFCSQVSLLFFDRLPKKARTSTQEGNVGARGVVSRFGEVDEMNGARVNYFYALHKQNAKQTMNINIINVPAVALFVPSVRGAN